MTVSTVKNSDSLVLQKALRIQTYSQPLLAEKDIAWISPKDYEALFGTNKENGPRYIQIAAQVFEVAPAKMSKGAISLAEYQSDIILEAIFNDHNHTMVTVLPFDPVKTPPQKVKQLEISIEQDRRFYKETIQQTVHIEELKRALEQKLKDKILSRRRSFILEFPWGTLKARITGFTPEKNGAKPSPFGAIGPLTEIKITPNFNKETILIGEVISKEVKEFEFYVSIDKRSNEANSNLLPMVVKEEEILKLIDEELSENVFCEDLVLTLPLKTGWDVKIRFNRPILSEEAFLKRGMEEIEFKKGYKLHSEGKIKLESHSNVIIATGPAKPAKEITFKISDMPGMQPITIDHDKERWISAKEFRSALILLKRPFASKEIFELRLSSGAFLVEVRKAYNDDHSQDLDKQTETLWTINPDTDIEFEAEKQLDLNIVKDETVREIKRAYIQIIGKKVLEDDLKLTLPELNVLGLTQAPNRLINHHRFTVVRDKGEKLEFKLMRVEFPEELKKPYTSFGKWTENTQVDFFPRIGEPITLMEKIFSDEISVMRFSLRASKLPDISKHRRPPILLNRDEVINKIRKEMDEHPFITVGHKITLFTSDGWEIEATFRKGVIKDVEIKDENEKTLVLSQSIKKGYSANTDTPIDLTVTSLDQIVLAHGEPIIASRLHLAVTEVLEDYTIDEASHVKGAWLNLEELKKEVLKLKRPIARGEKIAFELESGRYIIEIQSAKARDKNAKFPKKRDEVPWKIDNQTKIELKLDSKTNLKVVNDNTLYPLKKIKFLASQVNIKADHVSLKEKEFREALHEILPEKLIKGQILTFETKSGFSINAEVDDFQLSDELLSVDKKKIFVTIDENTEIQFRPKEIKKEEKGGFLSFFGNDDEQKSTLTINANPKILEVNDPIEYLEDLGMAGLDQEFKKVFRIFLSRSDKLKEEARRRHTKPIKGMLFFGPPGTGKTTLARHIGEMMGCSGERLQLFTATEMFNMWFGNSEENIRDMFAPARKAQEEYGDKSPLYIIIIDEIDALLPQRGSGNGSDTRDSLVNQFLGELDGLKEVRNLLVIGITNRKDSIDPAALRHGRLGEHIEIGLPDKKSRRKIFEVHTRHLVKEKLLGKGFDLDKLADKTENCPGAAIEGIVEKASLYSLERLAKLKGNKKDLKDHPDGLITMKDFQESIEDTMKTITKVEKVPLGMYQ